LPPINIRVASKASLWAFSPVGSPLQVADQLIEWYRNEACDGFVSLPPHLEEEDRLCLCQVVSRLQEAGGLRCEYPGTTLRDTLGLQRPASISQGIEPPPAVTDCSENIFFLSGVGGCDESW
jgi:hypothetical protein